MSKNPKVLIGVVTASQKDYCVEEFKQLLKSFTYDNYEILIVDNSEDPLHIETFKEFNVIHSPRFDEYDNYKSGAKMLADCQNIIRTKFLEGDYEYLFMLESDCFPEHNWLQWALSFGTQVFTTPYMVKVRYGVPSMCIQYLYTMSDKDGKNRVGNTLMLPPELIFPSDVRNITDFNLDNNIFLTHTGIGCTLISRDVFEGNGEVEGLKFRTDDENDKRTGRMTFSDTFFYTDCLIKQIEILLDNTNIIEHKKEWI